MKNVLLVDDDLHYQEIFKRRTDGKLKVTCVNDLAQAINTLKLSKFDCIVIDLNLPDSTPEQTIRNLKKEYPTAVCVAVTGSESPVIMAESIKAGAHGYLFKDKGDLTGEAIDSVISEAVIHSLIK